MSGSPLTENERELAIAAWMKADKPRRDSIYLHGDDGYALGQDARKWGNLVLEAYDHIAAELAALASSAGGTDTETPCSHPDCGRGAHTDGYHTFER